MNMITSFDSPLTVLAAGLFLGLAHSFEADHLAAVSTLITKQKKLRDFFILGGAWGVGHTLAILLVGVLVILFKVVIPESVSHLLEGLVGVMLIGLGARLAYFTFKEKLHTHTHTHGGVEHSHIHVHPQNKKNHQHIHQSMIIGLVHGLAGGAVLTLLIASSIQSPGLGLIYLLIFGAGSIIGMSAVSGLIGLPLSRLAHNVLVIKSIQYLAASASIGIGCMLALENLF